ncbi:dual specificity protein kinase yak1, partial [Perkinsus olseni]
TAVPCFGSAGGDGAWYLMHQFGDERLRCVVFDGRYKTWYYADHPESGGEFTAACSPLRQRSRGADFAGFCVFGDYGPAETEGPMQSTTNEGPMMESTTTEGPMMESTTTEGPMMESTTTEPAVVTSPPAGDTTVTPILP